MSRPRIAYKFYLELEPGELTEVFPVYESLSLVWQDVEGRFFKRRVLEGTLEFYRNDFDLIWAQDFDKEFIIQIYADLDKDGTYTPYWEGIFYKTNLQDVSITRREAKVSPDTNDKYRKILNGINNKYNFIDLEPEVVEIKEVNLTPLIQLYRPGDNYTANFIGTTYFEEAVTPESDKPTLEAMQFSTALRGDFIITGLDSALTPNVAGRYIEWTVGGPPPPAWVDLPIAYREDEAFWVSTNDVNAGTARIFNDTGTVVYIADSAGFPVNPINVGPIRERILPDGVTPIRFISQADPSSVVGLMSVGEFMARILTVRTDINGSPTTPLDASTDLVRDLGFYTRALELDLTVRLSEGHSVEPSRFNKFDEDAIHYDGEYFTRGSDIPSGNWQPCWLRDWHSASAWVEFDNTTLDLIEDGSSPYNLRDAYKMPDVISAFLGELDDTVTHEEDGDHSEFYYTVNDLRGTLKYPIFTPKSNIIDRKYSRAATISELSLGEMLDFLWGVHRVGWYLDGNKFRLEHISYFQNGGDYTTAQVQADFTSEVEIRTGGSWEREKDFFTFVETDLPERLEFAWMDDSYLPFRGYPIRVLSQYALNGGVERFDASFFTSDIDYMQANSNTITPKGLAYFECVQNESGEFIVPYVSIVIDATEEYLLQNGYASFLWMHDNYHKWWLPAGSVNLNRQVVAAESIRPVREQEVEYPYRDADPDWLPLITTSLGEGMIFEIKLPLTDRVAVIKLRHATTTI